MLTPQEVDVFVTLRQLSDDAVRSSTSPTSCRRSRISAIMPRYCVVAAWSANAIPAVELARGMAQLMIRTESKQLVRRGGRECRAALDRRQSRPVLRTPLRRRPQGHLLRSGGRRNLRHCRRRRQWPERTGPGAGRRNNPAPPFDAPLGRQAHRPSGCRSWRMEGLCSVPEERTGHAAVPDMTLAANCLLTARNIRNQPSCAKYCRSIIRYHGW